MSRKLSSSSLKSLFVPTRKEGPNRLLVVLHGLGDSLDGFRFLPDMLQIPGLNYLLVNAPDPYFTGYSWYEIQGQMEKGVVRSRGLLFQLMKEIEHQGFPPEHVGVLGFSQGCLMSVDLACRYPKKLGAVVGISGYVGMLGEYPEKFSPVADQQKLFITHGTDDPILPLAESRKQFKALKGMGLKIEWKVYEKEHTIEPRQEVNDVRSFLQKHLCVEEGDGAPILL